MLQSQLFHILRSASLLRLACQQYLLAEVSDFFFFFYKCCYLVSAAVRPLFLNDLLGDLHHDGPTLQAGTVLLGCSSVIRSCRKHPIDYEFFGDENAGHVNVQQTRKVNLRLLEFDHDESAASC